MSRTFADGCHRWGWAITIIVTIVLQIITVAYLAGSQSQKIHDLQEFLGHRVDRLEQQVDDLRANLP